MAIGTLLFVGMLAATLFFFRIVKPRT
jgi:hypothetical protein